jgi:hypothetical protein
VRGQFSSLNKYPTKPVNNVVFSTKAAIDGKMISPIRVKGIIIIPEIKFIENTVITPTNRRIKTFLPKTKPIERVVYWS